MTTSSISITIAPASAAVVAGEHRQFTAIVTGTPDASVSWSSDSGTIDANGLWQAPSTIGTAHVVARSVADPSKFAAADVAVEAPSNVSVTVMQPKVIFQIGNENTWSYIATVTGTTDKRVTWSVQEGPSGGSIDANGLYTIPFLEGTFHIVATSVADPTKSGVATATVGPNSNDLIDHAGAIDTHSRTFIVWWGDMSLYPADAQPAMEGFLTGLNGSSYLAIANEYMRGDTATTSFAGSLFDSATPPAETGPVLFQSMCAYLTTSRVDIQDGDVIVVTTPNFPTDGQGHYCAFHFGGTCGGRQISFIYTPFPAGSWCEEATSPCSSNGISKDVNGMVSSLSHEMIETITDPVAGSGWMSVGGGEIADLCGHEWCSTLSNGMTHQVVDLYSNAKHGCIPQ